MYLGYQNNKIKFYTEESLSADFYPVDEWVYTEDEYVLNGDEYVLKDDDWRQEQYNRRQAEFNKAFFNTSLGYVRRAVTMADGSHKDFLSDLLPVISMGVQSGTPVNILTYDKPPFDKDVTDWTEYQHQVVVTPQFIQECFLQLSNDFLPINEE